MRQLVKALTPPILLDVARSAINRPMTHRRFLTWWQARPTDLPPELYSMMDRFVDSKAFRDTSSAWLTLSMEHIEAISRYGLDNFQQTVASRAYWGEKYLDAAQIESVLSSKLEFRANIPASEIFRQYDNIPLAHSIQFAATVTLMVDWIERQGLLEFAATIYEPPRGNPVCIRYRDMDLSQEFLQTVIELNAIRDEVLAADTIVEIGPGSGRVSRAIKMLNPDAKIHLVDIPPALFLAQAVLGEGATYHLPGDDIGDCDLLIAIDCLHEMTSASVNRYFEFADKCASSFYFKCWESAAKSMTYGTDDYPVRKKWTKVFHEGCGVPSQYFHALYRI